LFVIKFSISMTGGLLFVIKFNISMTGWLLFVIKFSISMTGWLLFVIKFSISMTRWLLFDMNYLLYSEQSYEQEFNQFMRSQETLLTEKISISIPGLSPQQVRTVMNTKLYIQCLVYMFFFK
jgi:hypothetical protein